MAAAYNGHDRVVELLLGRHDVELGPNGEGETALYLAEIRGHAGAAELLRGSMLTGSYERETCVACQVSQGCQMAKLDPFLSLDCASVEGVGAQSKERKGSNFSA